VESATSSPNDQAMRADMLSSSLDVAALFDAHASFLARTVQRLSGAGPHVDDIVQEVFLVAHRRRHDIQGNGEVRGWLYRVAQNLVRHHGRAIARQRRLQHAYLNQHREQTSAPAPDASRARRDQAAVVHACVVELPLKLREVFVFYELEAMSAVEIARLLDLPENTVRSRLRLGRERFRSVWAEKTKQDGGTA
jgi:RNA polymerase sigma-70 factor (ECF subfamily)